MTNKKTSTKLTFKLVVLFLITIVFTTLFKVPEVHGLAIFNRDGNDGYYLSLTNDPARKRIMPLIIYDRHNVNRRSTRFLEWRGVEVNYANFAGSEVNFPAISNSDDAKDDFIEWAKDTTSSSSFNRRSPLTWTFPSFAGLTEASDYDATSEDLERATWVSETLIQDFNTAINFVHQASLSHGHGVEELSPEEFAHLVNKVAESARNAVSNSEEVSLRWNGVTVLFKPTPRGTISNVPNGIREGAYVTLEIEDDQNIKVTLVEHVHKGYRRTSNREYSPLYYGLPNQFKEIVHSDSETRDVMYLNWSLAALQSNSNWAGQDLTYETVSTINKTSWAEQTLTSMGQGLMSQLRQILGLFETSDLILNGGQRGSDQYYKGIMPTTWMQSANVLHWVSHVIAWMLVIGAIVKLLVQRNVSAINPSSRVDLINGIKNLMIVGFALSIFGVLFTGIVELNYLLVNTLASTGVGVSNFGVTPPSNGALASVVVGMAFLIMNIYFNFVYISRAFLIAILYAVGPMFVASIAFGEKYRQIFGSYAKELLGNIFVQSFHAILLVFFVGVSLGGSLRVIETLVLMMSFIPLSRFFKEAIGISPTAGDALTSGA